MAFFAAIPSLSCTDSVSSSDNALVRALVAAPVGTTATVVCPPRCLASGEALDAPVYGCGNFYSFRSSLCKAAIHAGVHLRLLNDKLRIAVIE